MRLCPRSVLTAALAFAFAAPARGADVPRPAEPAAPPPAKDAPASQPPAAPVSSSPPGVQVSFEDTLRIHSGDGAFETRIGGCLLLHYRGVADRPPEETNARTSPDTFFLRTARIDLAGTVWKEYDFKLELQVCTGTTSATTGSLGDGYFGWRPCDAFNLRLGQFKVPISQERTCSIRYIDFPERSLVSRLVPGEDLGVMAFGSFAEKAVLYEAAVINGTGRSVTDTNDQKEAAARLRICPFLLAGVGELGTLRLGVAGTRGRVDSAAFGAGTSDALDTATTELAATFLNATSGAFDGPRTRLGAELSWCWGPASLRGEVLRRTDTVDAAGSTGISVRQTAWYAAATWLLTGETKQTEARGVPDRPFDPAAGGWGAVELAARVSQLSVDGAVFDRGLAAEAGNANRATAVAVGVNWWPRRCVRLSPTFVWEHFDDPVDFGGDARRRLLGALVRAQIDF
jgi:phosphate-selective porin OprO/OprP